MGKYIAGIDGGTMGVRCVIVDEKGNEVSSAYFETPTQYPKPGWVEQNAEDFMALALKSTAAAISKGNLKGGRHRVCQLYEHEINICSC